MKTVSRLLIAAFALSSGFSASLRAEQPSIDQLAIDSGVVAWVSAWNPGDKPFDVTKLRRLYRANVVSREGERTLQSWAEYARSLEPCVGQFAEMVTKPAAELKVDIAERRAETRFVIHPAGKRKDGTETTATARVRLLWAKEGGMWQITEQDIVCSKDSDTSAVAAR